MKTTITIILFLSCLMGFGQYYVPKYKYVEHECTICGKTIYTQEEVQIQQQYWGYDYNGIDPGFYQQLYSYFRGEDQYEMACTAHVALSSELICQGCKTKYFTNIIDKVNSIWEIGIEKAKNENRSERAMYDKQRTIDKIQAIDNQIEKLKTDIDRIQHPEKYKTKDVDSMRFHGWMRLTDTLGCDTVLKWKGTGIIKLDSSKWVTNP